MTSESKSNSSLIKKKGYEDMGLHVDEPFSAEQQSNLYNIV